jgi:hypothetical protein
MPSELVQIMLDIETFAVDSTPPKQAIVIPLIEVVAMKINKLNEWNWN